ncbi:hypothetical protein GQ53DRAFT_748500 [Thozetella sp. PMI_491]|nr:hypothetical protein GQ53DRAFT_748500 [Thozetella sp. PMI_491]
MKFQTVLALLPLVYKVQADAIHLVNCDLGYSEMLYYVNDADSQNGQVPADGDICQWVRTITWEGQSNSCTFRTGVTATSNIQSGAGSYAVGKYAGSASNGFHNFNCYRDSNRLIYKSGEASCYSIYYCLS